MEVIGYLSSILMGLSLGLIGGGGSILTVPILVYLFALPPVVATGYSLFIVGLTALFGGINFMRQKQVDFKTGLIFAVPSFLGVYAARAWVVPALPDTVFQMGAWSMSKNVLIMLVFSVLMILASYSMIRKAPVARDRAKLSPLRRHGIIGLEGLVVGCVTGFVGAGGGFLIIPALVILVGLPMKKAVGTSLFIIAIKSLFGFLGEWQRHPGVDWQLLLSIAGIAITGIFIGSYVSRFVAENRLKKVFGWFVLVMGSGILLQQTL
ncbi:MAG TPA: sulfite exporter TauE/SafE family protein [Oligoflexus sp.]|uniref:sulfite exporter TauE/SafE family protein n=1 Tax=Oligoflexus sp. TaxID=1971216 RepID=UPI002D4484DE|nr:sulfite exporter TauE/SafE family protein [Oligoflexus sp.]HYX33833.1 sulfite exporter TauE/SafE family protein [Oligoflexus sp.]